MATGGFGHQLERLGFKIDAGKIPAHTRRMAKTPLAGPTAKLPGAMGDGYYWANDHYWTEALDKYCELKDKGKKKFVIDLEKLSEVVYDGDGPAYKLMEAMVSVNFPSVHLKDRRNTRAIHPPASVEGMPTKYPLMSYCAPL